MNLVIAGGTGFIGSALCTRLLEQGPKKRLVWNPPAPGHWEKALDGADGVINLAGEPIAAKRWSERRKEKIRQSRIETTRALVSAVAKAGQKPKFLINASAVGFYGPHGDETLSEDAQAGNDFLAQTCREWEAEAIKAEAYGLRVARLRTGVVLGRGGGALAKMAPPFKLFIGGPLGSGRQWMSWIHMDDEVGLILALIERSDAHGAFNATAPNPVTMREFCRNLGRVLNRPSWAPVPAFALRLLLGEMADMLLTGQRVLPAAAQKLGYTFRYPKLYEALAACMPP
ncbi:MAG: TIGR01777 family protein [Deltaproteobacteria bacterium]|nr:TIGR01777 family protein [Deltaproteobacteria bacterium]